MKAIGISRDAFGHKNPENLEFKSEKGLSEDVVKGISSDKNEPWWMLQKRLKALEIFGKKPMPAWGPSLSELNLDWIYFYLKPKAEKNSDDWKKVPRDIRETYEKLGIPQAERRALAGVGAQYE